MLSICIPVFEQDAGDLVRELHRQAGHMGSSVQIILIDDHSPSTFIEALDPLATMARIVKLERNIGRAGIRNLFLQHTDNEHLLFLDGDSLIIRHDFIDRYLEALKDGKADVVCGGRVYSPKAPDREHHLHWTYGRHTESRTLTERQADPYGSFMTHNFAIRRSLFEKQPFNEQVKGYGHEDTLFGHELQQRGVAIRHIDNPVLHGELSDNRTFLQKSEEAIRNLIFIERSGIGGPDFSKGVKLMRTRDALKSKGLTAPFRWLYKLTNPILLPLLRSGYLGAPALQFHKLGYLLTRSRKLPTGQLHVGSD
jgi:glycosyltransferase involved in cell wall biosynthesis